MTSTGTAGKGIGNQSPQYKSIQKHYASLVGLLKINSGTRSNLTDQLTTKGWLVPGSSATPNNFIDLALERIKYNATEYDDFITMLQESGGAEHVVDDLLGSAAYI